MEIVLSSEASKAQTNDRRIFSDHLSNSIVAYMAEKEEIEKLLKISDNKNVFTEHEQQLAKNAFSCYLIITKAHANGFLKEGSNLLGKLDECRKRNAELMKDLATCMANYTALQNEHKQLMEMLDQNQSEELVNQEKKNE